jgi:serine/threonine-protein kinase
MDRVSPPTWKKTPDPLVACLLLKVIAMATNCDPARIKMLLEDRLPDDGQTELERHLETCVECQQQLESQAADLGWWDEARQFLQPSVGQVANLPPAGHGPRCEPASNDEDVTDDLPLGLLRPSDDPAMLGRLGQYEIVEAIGRGGMGIVLKGYDPQLNRFVAIKVLAPHLAASGAARQRFAREARAAAAVVHEHVIAIHSINVESSPPYLVMPLIAGQSLQQRIDRTGPLELKEILRIGAQVAEGLAAAHAQGLVHRDIKPANILLENGVERVKITDFGLARAIDDATVTHSGFLAGTPQYMAPEQARGELIDHRCDLFSLGSVLYAMCAGHSPFRAETTMAVLRRLCEDSPTPLRQVNADVPVWLAEIVEKLHAKDPAERFQSASEVAELLAQHLAHCQQPLASPMPPPLRYRSPAARATRRRLFWITSTGVLLLAAVAGTAGLVHWTAQVRALRGSPSAVRGSPDHAWNVGDVWPDGRGLWSRSGDTEAQR